ncbi:hypothetical protein MBLNU457_5928t1 [Dothideomycetes sp. NU457]
MESEYEPKLSELLRLALRATAFSDPEDIHITASGQRESPTIRLLLWSRRFILTYQAVLIAFLVIFTAQQWSARRSLARKQQDRSRKADQKHSLEDGGRHDDTKVSAVVEDYERSTTTSSSGSSTVEGDATLPSTGKSMILTGQNEETPLLGRETEGYRSPRRTAYHTIRSWLMYQPPNVPVVNKVLPSNATTLLVLFFLGINLFYLLFRIPASVWAFFIFGDRAGLLFAANLPLLYFLSAKNGPFRLLTGHSYEGVNIIHRRLGEFMCLLAILHGISFILVWYFFLFPRVSFLQLLSEKIIWLGLATLACYESLYFTSLASFRQRFYEVFLASHIFLQLGALGFLFFHHHGSRPYVGIALGIIVLDRILFRAFVKRRTIPADLTVLEDGETVLLSANWSIPSRTLFSRIFNHDILYGWQPTEHIYVSIPALGGTHALQAHPFTIFSAAPDMSMPNAHAWLNLVIRAHSGFSSHLLRHAVSHPNTSLQIDGPYGSHHALELLHASSLSVVVAGGLGIAVAYPLLRSLLHSEHKIDVVFVWVIHSALHIEWLGQERLDELKALGAEVVIPGPTDRNGRPDVGPLVKDVVHRRRVGRDDSVGVVVSGPDGMNRGVRNACAEMVGEGLDVGVAVEKFGW